MDQPKTVFSLGFRVRIHAQSQAAHSDMLNLGAGSPSPTRSGLGRRLAVGPRSLRAFDREIPAAQIETMIDVPHSGNVWADRDMLRTGNQPHGCQCHGSHADGGRLVITSFTAAADSNWKWPTAARA